MATAIEAVRDGCETLTERATEVWRRAAKMTEEVGALKTAMKDAVEEGKEAATKGVEQMRRQVRDLRHVPDDLAYRVRHEPLRAVGLAVGVGLVAGCLFGWFVGRSAHKA